MDSVRLPQYRNPDGDRLAHRGPHVPHADRCVQTRHLRGERVSFVVCPRGLHPVRRRGEGGCKSEDGSASEQKSEVRSQKSEGRRQKAEGRGQKSESMRNTVLTFLLALTPVCVFAQTTGSVSTDSEAI